MHAFAMFLGVLLREPDHIFHRGSRWRSKRGGARSQSQAVLGAARRVIWRFLGDLNFRGSF